MDLQNKTLKIETFYFLVLITKSCDFCNHASIASWIPKILAFLTLTTFSSSLCCLHSYPGRKWPDRTSDHTGRYRTGTGSLGVVGQKAADRIGMGINFLQDCSILCRLGDGSNFVFVFLAKIKSPRKISPKVWNFHKIKIKLKIN